MNYEVNKEFKIIKFLGQGAYGEVLLVEKEGQKYALKIIKKGSFDVSEIDILMDVSKIKGYNKYFPRIYKRIDYSNSIGILMEYIQGENLYNIYESGKKLSEKNILLITKEILKGLKLLNDNGIAHRDIKDENVIVLNKNTNKPVIKIVDFGFSCYYKLSLDKKLSCSNVKGTKLFMAPEVLRQEVLKNPSLYQYSDVWAVGIIIWEFLMMNDPPIPVDLYPEFNTKNYNPDVMREIYKKEIKESLPKLPSGIKCFILACLEPNSLNRPTASELLSLLKMVK